MTTINQLSGVDTVFSGDLVPVFSTNNGDARKAAMSVIRKYMLDNFINDLEQSLSAIVDDDLLAIYDFSQNKSVKVSASLLLSYMQANLIFPSTASLFQNYVTQYAAPSSNGFTVTVNNNSNNTWLILTPTAGFANGTIILPAIANVIDKQEVLINCTQQINALTINGNGAVAVTGEPAVIAADDFFRLRFDSSTSSWYRVG